jgi:sugar O-acyltransferase (sialic acid O-acetyltransferase NeuD family)
MSHRVLILGTRTLAEELSDLISEVPGWEVAGFVENMEPEKCGRTLAGLPVYWVDELAGMAQSHVAVCGLATVHRSRFIDQAAALGVKTVTFVHPTARISRTAVVGDGCFVSPLTVVSSNTVLGAQVFLNRGVLVGHHTKIGSYCTLQPGANIAGCVHLGPRTYVGMGALVLDNLKIGELCVVGAGAVVTRDLPDRVQAVGMPAKIVKTGIEGK